MVAKKYSRYSYISDLLAERLYLLYSAMRKTGRYQSLVDISRTIELMPMPVHYISVLQAQRCYSQYFFMHKKLDYKYIGKQILYNSFINRCKDLRSNRPELSDSQVIREALLSEAPCAGLSEGQIRRILRSKGAR